MEQGPHRSTRDRHPGPEEEALGEHVDSLAGTTEVIHFLFLSFRDNYCIYENASWHLVPSLHVANRWGNSGNSDRLYLGGAPKSLQMDFANKCLSNQGYGFSNSHLWM